MEYSQIFKILDGDPHTTDYYANKIFEDTGILPAQCYKINDDKDLFLKFLTGVGEKTIQGAENLRKFKQIGLEIKLNNEQQEKNTIYVNSAPITILETDPDQLLEEINRDNPNLMILNLYAPPLKSYKQKLTSIKLTLASRIMTNSCFKFGIKIKGCLIPAINIKQGLYTKTPQCNNCNGFHQQRNCSKEFPSCAHCGGKHKRFLCDSKNPRPQCSNCRGPHRATSNSCPKRREFLTDEFISDTKETDLVCPYQKPKEKETFIPAPAPNNNFWEQPRPNKTSNQNGQNHTSPPQTAQLESPMSTYSDCMKLALHFQQWYPAFLILQSLMGLRKLELPEALRKNIKTDEIMGRNKSIFLDTNLQDQNQNQNQEQNVACSNEPLEEPGPYYTPASRNTQPATTWVPSHKGYYGQPLTGANLIPLPQRDNKQKRALLPTPTDPFSKSSNNMGAIAKQKSKSLLPKQTIQAGNHGSTQTPLESGFAPPQPAPFPFSEDDGWSFAVNKTNNITPTNTLKPKENNNKKQMEGNEESTIEQEKERELQDPNSLPTISTGNVQNIQARKNSTDNNENSNPKTNTQIQEQLNEPSTQNQKTKPQPPKIKPPIKTKPDLSKYKPTQEIPSFLKNKLPHNRHSMDPTQFRSTILSFEALSNAALKKAEMEYNNTKEEFLLNTSLPEFQKEKEQAISTTLTNTQLSPPQASSSQINTESITTAKYTIGTYQSANETIHTRKPYKHPTPPPQTSDTENEDDVDIMDQEDSDTLPDLAHSPINQTQKRQLRSNSRQKNYPTQ